MPIILVTVITGIVVVINEVKVGVRKTSICKVVVAIILCEYSRKTGEKFGGDIAYIYNFGIRQLSQKRESTEFAPDLFSPVLREYSQRIIATTTLQIEVLRTPTLTSFITTTIPVMTVTNIIGNFVSLTTFMTAAGLTLTTAMTTMMTMESRMANVEVTVHRSNGIILTTFGRSRILATLPPATAPRPYVLTITIQPLVVIFSDAIVIISPLPQFPVGALLAFPPSGGGTFTITIVQGSEEFISITTMVSTTTEMQTSPPISTDNKNVKCRNSDNDGSYNARIDISYHCIDRNCRCYK